MAVVADRRWHRIIDAHHTYRDLGNLDLTSFENVQKRRDVLRTYGSYTQPLLLLKVLPTMDQVNWNMIALAIPANSGLAWALWKTRRNQFMKGATA